MISPPPPSAQSAFERANQLWFWEGRTREAARLYALAAQASPNDEAVQVQHARATWLLEGAAAGRSVVETALAGGVGQAGGESLRDLVARLGQAVARPPAGLAPADCDADLLADRPLATSDWAALAVFAHRLGAFGLAAFARSHAKGPFTIADEEKDDYRSMLEAEDELARLEALHDKPA